MKTRSLYLSVLIASLALGLGTNSASATSITFTSAGTGGDGPLSASATVTTSAGLVTVVLTNTLSIANFNSVGQSVSDFSFALNSAPGTLSGSTAVGQQGNISSAGIVTYVSGSPGRFVGTGGGMLTISGNTITLEAIGGGKPTELIAPFMANGGTYATNPGIGAHNPYTIGPGTFTLSLAGVTSATTISPTGAMFSFGTGPDTFLPGVPSTPPPPVVPELPSGLLALTGVASIAASRVVRYYHLRLKA